MNKKEAIKNYKECLKKINAYYLMLSTAYYDKQTIAPKAGNKYRNEMFAIMSGEAFMVQIDPKYIESVNYLNSIELPFEFKREITLVKKSLDSITRFSKEDVMEYDLACSDSFDAWEKGKQTNNYALWAPKLLKIIELSKKRAKIRNPKKDAYDLYLDDYEEGMTRKDYDKFFNNIKEKLVPVIKQINNKQEEVDDSFLYKYYPKEKQEKFIKEALLPFLGFDSSWGYMGVSEHPFTSGFHNGDIRTTTSYDEYNVASSIFSVIHETGHAFYMHQVDKKFEGTSIEGGISSGMHESQSRFFENYLGRRKSFWITLYPKLQKIFPENLGYVDVDQFVRAINASRSSLIRTDADELTYPLHILIRYEIEKGIYDNKVDLNNLNKLWNKKYKEYLGVDVPNDTKGILQDIHWSDGSFGYFPTYALGSAIGAQLLHKMEKDIDIDDILSKGQFKKITNYLKNNLQKYGALYDYNKLLEMATGEKFKSKYYIDYLTKKYKKLYKIK